MPAMELIVKQRLVTGGAIVAAAAAGWQIAHGSFGLAGLVAGTALLWIASRLLRIGPDVMVAGAVLAGYLIGNRGFAQLHVPNVPLLPAEFALGLGLALGLWQWARSQTLPVRHDALNAMLLLWIVISAVRLPLDLRQFGLMAVRDFAMVYYALFFFLAQAWSADAAGRRWLENCLTVGLALTVPVFIAFLSWPEFFLSTLTVAGVPLIFIKSDVGGAFMAAATFWFAERFARQRRPGWFLLCGLSLLGVAISNSRAAALAFVIAAIVLLLLRGWRTLLPIGALAALGLAGLAVHAAVIDRPFTATPLYRIYESAASVIDVSGSRVYQSTELSDKPDNNQFRWIWWRAVVDETWASAPWFGLGFGHDLAADFLRIYYADANDEFTARSPHNFVLSVLARTGLAGLLAFLAMLAALARQTWRLGRARAGQPAPESRPWWLAVWAIFVSACFGVVLEGPMGAVVFWTMLGLANGLGADDPEEAPTPAASSGRERSPAEAAMPV